MGFLAGEIRPLTEVKCLKGTVIAIKNDVSVALKEQSQCTARGANVDRLPQAIKH
jgi:hypothetical protein